MAFEEQIENFKDQIRTSWSNFQETETYSSIKEQYDDLSPTMQKVLKLSLISFAACIVFLMISGMFSDASDYLDRYQTKKESIRELIKLKRDMASTPRVQSPPPMATIQSTIEAELSKIGIAKEQIASVNTGPIPKTQKSNLIPPGIQTDGLYVSLTGLNLRQVVNVGRRLQNESPSTVLTTVNIKASAKDNHYYDVKYGLTGFYPPQVTAESDNNKRNSNKRRRPKKKPGRGR